MVSVVGVVAQEAHLGRIAVFQDDVQVAVLIQVCQGVGTSVFGEVQSRDAGDVNELAVAEV